MNGILLEQSERHRSHRMLLVAGLVLRPGCLSITGLLGASVRDFNGWQSAARFTRESASPLGLRSAGPCAGREHDRPWPDHTSSALCILFRQP